MQSSMSRGMQIDFAKSVQKAAEVNQDELDLDAVRNLFVATYRLDESAYVKLKDYDWSSSTASKTNGLAVRAGFKRSMSLMGTVGIKVTTRYIADPVTETMGAVVNAFADSIRLLM
ncbi:hypothetical protein BST61_g7599 [Cercospora zeina]